jgi:hypothetical protein
LMTFAAAYQTTPLAVADMVKKGTDRRKR